MNWEQIAGICQAEFLRMRESGAEFPEFFPEARYVAVAFLAHERETNEAVAAAVSHFAALRSWPELSVRERMMLSFRLDYAASLASLLAQQPAPWTDSEDLRHDEERLQWLMLFAWENEGFSTFHDNLRRMIAHEAV